MSTSLNRYRNNSHSDYAIELRRRNITFRKNGNHLLIGQTETNSNWVLHISILEEQIPELLKNIIPAIKELKIGFKIANHKQIARQILNGDHGYENLGKIIELYPNNDQHANEAAKVLIRITQRMRGPDIPTDALLGGRVYAQFNQRLTKQISRQPTLQNNYAQINVPSNIAFSMPQTTKWPFDFIQRPKARPIITLNNSYLITKTLKNDIKGKVFKALRIQKFAFKICLIKEAKHDIFTNSYGQDITYRLLWQKKILTALAGLLPVPKVYEIFKEFGNTYLVTEYINGVTCTKFVQEILKGRSWRSISLKQRAELIKMISKIAFHIHKLHELGYVHRDITPANFIVTKSGNIVLIDLELTVSLKPDHHHLIEISGTPGYQPPERKTAARPTQSEDAFSLGALLFFFITGVSPSKITPAKPYDVQESVLFFSRNELLASLVSRMLNPDPAMRPEIPAFIEALEPFTKGSLNIPHSTEGYIASVPPSKISLLVEKGLRALTTAAYFESEKFWHSNEKENSNFIKNTQHSKYYYDDISCGTAGIVIGTSALSNNHSLEKCFHVELHRAINKLKSEAKLKLDNYAPGLVHGTFGIAVALADSIRRGYLRGHEDVYELIDSYLNKPYHRYNATIESGAAGLGMAIINSLPVIGETYIDRLRTITNSIITLQSKNGSWEFEGDLFTGLLKGTAGVIIFLTRASQYLNDSKIVESVCRGADWLDKESIPIAGKLSWFESRQCHVENPWLGSGYTGIALAFIEAYRLTRQIKYKQLAIYALNLHPSDLVSNSLSLTNGVSGIGEVYLHAFKIFNDEYWMKRATWICELLSNTCIKNDRHSTWITEPNRLPTAGLMEGQLGVIHFLHRFANPSIDFPILNL